MIRLSRTGRKKQPHYRFVIAEKGRTTKTRALEILGHYHPLDKDAKTSMVINKERIEHWIKEGAGLSNTVKNLLIDKGIVKGEKSRTISTYKSKKEDSASPETSATAGEKKDELKVEEKKEKKEEEVKVEEKKPEEKEPEPTKEESKKENK